MLIDNDRNVPEVDGTLFKQQRLLLLFDIQDKREMNSSDEKIWERLTFWTDPGHGWLQVPLEIFREIGGVASDCSYVDAENIYLEEDCDAHPVLVQISERYRIPVADLDARMADKYEENIFIRNLNHWQGWL